MEVEKDISLNHPKDYYNISYIIDKYDEIKKSSLNYVLIQLNIKNFRYYNTKYGFEQGDEILGLIFKCLRSFLAEKEYVSYLYADNFILLLNYTDLEYLVYDRMLDLVDKLYRIEDARIHRSLFASFGLYKVEDKRVAFHDALNYANLCRKETDGLYTRSQSWEVYDKTFHDKYMNRLELEMKTADAYKNYEFVAYLQPKVNLESEEVVSAEALLRWFDKDGNSVPLYQFLPILDQNGYIELVDIDIFDQICQYMDKRIKENKKVVPISFNISKAYFYNPNMLEDYIRVFEKYDIPIELIEIEFMESISLNDTEHMRKVINGFKEYGFTCVLDDFGNGYSSFNVLLNAKLDIVKMDRQFFLDNLNGDNKLVIKTMVDLIHSLKMKVVAEGVEQKEHIDFLKECGCDIVQGYYYYKPMSVDTFLELLDKK